MTSEKERQKELYEYITTAHMLCLIIFVLAIILSGYDVLPQKNFYPFINIDFFILLCSMGAVIVLLYNTRISQLPKNPKSIHCIDIAYVGFPLLVATLTLFVTEKKLPYAQAILLLPIFITASVMGKLPGLIMATICSILLVFNEMLITPGINILQATESGLILISLMYVVGWFIGGLANLETRNREYLTEIANTDILTGLYNHRYFQEVLKKYFSKGITAYNRLSLIILDIDYFKNYNDTFGHLAGDEVLRTFGILLKKEVKDSGFVARYGGEEFVVVLPGYNSQQALEKAEDIKDRIEQQQFFGEEHQPGGKITISCGIATSPDHAVKARGLIKQADNALYKAKGLNKNKVELYFSVFDDLELDENEKDLLNSIRTLISVINAKDRYTYGHSERVTEYSIKLAEKIGVSEQEMQLLRYAAFLHDIGKIEIDRDTLTKPGRLNEQEWGILKQHPRWGSDIVKSVTSLRSTVPIILYHHENYDGSGYPEGIKEESIPTLARIIRITDSFDAMTSNRTYKTNMSPDEAIAEIKRCSGSMYDPELARNFIEIVQANTCIKNLHTNKLPEPQEYYSRKLSKKPWEEYTNAPTTTTRTNND